VARNTGMPEGVYQKNAGLGATGIWGAINWPKYWDAHPGPFSMSVSRFPRYPVLRQNRPPARSAPGAHRP
jgi:hypothetical protein